MKEHLKTRIKTFINKMYIKTINNMLLDCFPRITTEEAKELSQLLKSNKKGENH